MFFEQVVHGVIYLRSLDRGVPFTHASADGLKRGFGHRFWISSRDALTASCVFWMRPISRSTKMRPTPPVASICRHLGAPRADSTQSSWSRWTAEGRSFKPLWLPGREAMQLPRRKSSFCPGNAWLLIEVLIAITSATASMMAAARLASRPGAIEPTLGLTVPIPIASAITWKTSSSESNDFAGSAHDMKSWTSTSWLSFTLPQSSTGLDEAF